eukprot:GHVU01144288.1.p1 GENE.GHVU01144288.1~~GHVU01144288.1.p1  ORF type:complete len:798 (-),score=217.37 GHVU01144288.1:75-2468(-)
MITPFYDSLLVKLIATAPSFEEAVGRADRALSETRIRGVKTNINFIRNTLRAKPFLDGDATVTFIDDHPELLYYDTLDLCSQNICKYLAEVSINGSFTPIVNAGTTTPRHIPHAPPLPATAPRSEGRMRGGGSWAVPMQNVDTPKLGKGLSGNAPAGYKQLLDSLGPAEFAKAIRQEKRLLLTDTTMRDAHQSLLATRVRSHDLFAVAPAYAYHLPQLFSIENWGGATFDVAYRFLYECPWNRLERLREDIPNIPFQMLLRGANAVGYTSYSDNAVFKFCEEASKYGIDIFRVFDSLNDMDSLKLGIDASGAAGGVVEAAISYTGNIADPNRKPYTLDYYLELARKLVEDEGVHILAIKDMAGLLTPDASELLFRALRKEFPNTPLHFHTHDTGGWAVASSLRAADAGCDIVDGAFDSMSGMTSQPSLGAVIASTQDNPSLQTGITLDTVSQFSDYWEQVRRLYPTFDCTATQKSGSSDILQTEIPGGQYTNLHMQAFALGMADKWPQIKQSYKEANEILGDIIKVTPSSKMVGDLAQFMVQNGVTKENILEKADELSFPTSVVEYFQGFIGKPPFGFPEELRLKVLKGLPVLAGRPGAELPDVDWTSVRTHLEETHDKKFRECDLVSHVLYPKVFDDYQTFLKNHGDVSVLPTPNFFTGVERDEKLSVDMNGREVEIKYVSSTHLLNDGTREVFFEVMGLPRTISVRDRSAKKDVNMNVVADPSDKKQIGAPMPGNVLSYKVSEGDKVDKGTPLVILSAMKMETVVVAPVAGVVKALPLKEGAAIQAGDLLISLEE